MREALISLLVPELRKAFPDLPFHFGDPADKVIVYPAKHDEVGAVEVHDDGEELTLYLGRFTHIHMSNYEDRLSEAEKAEEIIRSTVAFLTDLFGDRVVLWGSHAGGGGTYRLGSKAEAFCPAHAPRYVWSGPVIIDDSDRQSD